MYVSGVCIDDPLFSFEGAAKRTHGSLTIEYEAIESKAKLKRLRQSNKTLRDSLVYRPPK